MKTSTILQMTDTYPVIKWFPNFLAFTTNIITNILFGRARNFWSHLPIDCDALSKVSAHLTIARNDTLRRSSRSLPLHGMTAGISKRKLLLIYIHGFMGSETSFYNFLRMFTIC